MALTLLVAALPSGPCAGVAVSGTVQVVIDGIFVIVDPVTGWRKQCQVSVESSPDGGTTWIPIPGGQTDYPTTVDADLGAGGQIRITVNNGGTGFSINAYYGTVV
jgi:hypothetical protein